KENLKFLPHTNKESIQQDSPRRVEIYYFHPDHLGTATYLSDVNGNPYQFFLNLPFGESMADQRTGAFENRYKFNGKELDEETGLYYYGARYYDSSISVWLSVDPIALWQPVLEVEHYIEGQHNGGYFNSQNINVYGYTYQNPIIYVDPNGKQNYFSHGTGFTSSSNYFGKNLTKNMANDFAVRNKYFNWSGGLKDKTIVKAGHQLTQQVLVDMGNRKKSTGSYFDGPIILTGHSNGANVSRVAMKGLVKSLLSMKEYGLIKDIPDLYLIMINAPTLSSNKEFEFDNHTNGLVVSVQIDAYLDIVAGAGQAYSGSGALGPEFYDGTHYKIEYEDRLSDWSIYGWGNHNGQRDENANIWYPALQNLLFGTQNKLENDVKTERP
ncbi:MAG: RHS repeat-associated core domain-containing protein, partial [Bacteroidia bacterium]|nr:RHS repeat-associated core domain-containing protein [Bacteroidia bacterium]